LRWLQSGRISHDSDLVNLVHVDDIVRYSLLLLSAASGLKKGIRFNFSGGTFSWKEVVEFYHKEGLLKEKEVILNPGFSEKISKRVSSQKLQDVLPSFSGWSEPRCCL
jgi:nucleoside-diphosphate-sugar epimerase